MPTPGQSFLDVDPRKLRLPPTRLTGADPLKLHEQIRRHGNRCDDVPPLLVTRGLDNEFMINDGVTRAFRVARLCPRVTIRVEVIAERAVSLKHLPTVEERL